MRFIFSSQTIFQKQRKQINSHAVQPQVYGSIFNKNKLSLLKFDLPVFFAQFLKKLFFFRGYVGGYYDIGFEYQIALLGWIFIIR